MGLVLQKSFGNSLAMVFHFLWLMCAIALVSRCTLSLAIPDGNCPKITSSVNTTTLRGEVWTWSFSSERVASNCTRDTFVFNDIVAFIPFKVFATDNKTYAVIYICADDGKHHSYVITTVSREKKLSPNAIKDITKAFQANRIDTNNILTSCNT